VKVFIVSIGSYSAPQGGITVFAKDWTRAKDLIMQYETSDHPPFDIRDLKSGPDFSVETIDCDEQIFDFTTMPFWG